MNVKLNLILSTITLISLSCSNNKKEQHQITNSRDGLTTSNQEGKNDAHIDIQPKYNNDKMKVIDSKKEIRSDGNFNQMTLFEVDKDISLNQLKDYCSTAKSDYTNGYFQILVFFKKSNTAKFPNNPVTGLYMEDEDMKNIKAIYTINNMNGYSKLDYYDNNSFESLAKTIDIN
ncbi:hypothetical protein [Chryseobacterium sp. JM1]|uniref:hypothetical protein n=1 Tax=Chryseobacterium sp. JM1 TaxID=1233950 RepID=UPI0004E609EC|nr:hypothetical protein [Chryseobacterium sp. JM1]KFF17175.1 hypothetical protein IW22_21270 [Chryseobacterium sp. JM1]